MKTYIYYSTVCPTCTRAADAPYRVYDDRGRVVAGCIDHFHTGHLITPSESARWHFRPEAKKMRIAAKTARMGGVTERAA